MRRIRRAMNDLVDLVIDDENWMSVDLAAIAETAAHLALSAVGMSPAGHEIGMLACSDRRIAELNGTFRSKPTPTNVLSWPATDLSPATLADRIAAQPATPDDWPISLGDIAIAYETCKREAEAAGITMQDHATHLIVHACLHLLGYDHETDADAEVMEGIETKALASVGIADPYSRPAQDKTDGLH